ncbi:AprI/Inh family metalloprotease inhibitor [Brevundimonas sp.]|uniref:AprI/Inh family metalloprotease inhibitor n=1 Tax=Brevundimonas sp. TaxID=1871086 RepID=UPI003D12B16C
MTRDRSTVCAAFAGAILVTGCAAPPASSEPQGRVLAVDQVAGYWALRAPDGARCSVSLANLVIDGVRPVLAERCGIPAATRAKSWRATAGGFEMLAADGSVLMAFRRTGEDAFAATSGGFILSRAPVS